MVDVVFVFALCNVAKKANKNAERCYREAKVTNHQIMAESEVIPMTNFQKITEGKEMIDVVAGLYADQGCPTQDICDNCQDDEGVGSCVECWKKWLNEEYKE